MHSQCVHYENMQILNGNNGNNRTKHLTEATEVDDFYCQ